VNKSGPLLTGKFMSDFLSINNFVFAVHEVSSSLSTTLVLERMPKNYFFFKQKEHI